MELELNTSRVNLHFTAGKTVVITGGGRGIGEEAVKKFLRLGVRVIVGCRSPDKVQAQFDQQISEGKLAGTVECLTSLASVRTFARAVIALNTPIHVLANNAGKGRAGRARTDNDVSGIMFGPRKEFVRRYQVPRYEIIPTWYEIIPTWYESSKILIKQSS